MKAYLVHCHCCDKLVYRTEKPAVKIVKRFFFWWRAVGAFCGRCEDEWLEIHQHRESVDRLEEAYENS